MFDFKIEGMKEIEKSLNNLPEQLQHRATANALRAGARVVRNAAKANVSDDPEIMGEINVTTRAKKYGDPKVFVNSHHWRSIIKEYGTLDSRREPLSAKTKRKKSWKVRKGETSYRAKRRGMPTGMRGIGFMRKAFDTQAPAAIRAFENKIRKEIERLKLL